MRPFLFTGFYGIMKSNSMTRIEHLSPEIFPAFAPMLLGVYHPQLLLITTPSYGYNARFTAPKAPKSARRGYLDPTRRTERIFRHSDHKFEWTFEEFRTWCEDAAKEWGYEAEISGVGRAVEPDPWNRENELGDASSVACFRKTDAAQQDTDREERGRKVIEKLALPSRAHQLHTRHAHEPQSSAEKPRSLQEIGAAVVKKMDSFNEAFMRMEELWFEPEVSSTCGGWIELLVRAIEECEDLELQKEGDMGSSRSRWTVQRIGALTNPISPWPQEGETSLDYIPPEWEPEESEESVGADGDVSWNNSEIDTEDESRFDWGTAFVQLKTHNTTAWGSGDETEEDIDKASPTVKKRGLTSTTDHNSGWDGDASEIS